MAARRLRERTRVSEAIRAALLRQGMCPNRTYPPLDWDAIAQAAINATGRARNEKTQ